MFDSGWFAFPVAADDIDRGVVQGMELLLRGKHSSIFLLGYMFLIPLVSFLHYKNRKEYRLEVKQKDLGWECL